MPWLWFTIGLVIGVAFAGVAARVVLVRSVRRVTAAERRARTAERLAEVGAMTGGLAHEIKNPLSTIGLNAQLLAEGIEDLDTSEADRARLLRRVGALRRETDRLRGILEDFLEFAGELRLDRREADLNAMADELVDFYQPQAAALGVLLRAEPAQGPLVAPLDVSHLKQAALNLMLNATYAMSEASAEGSRELILRTSGGEDEAGSPVVRLHVIDTGPGIAEDVRASIFRPYFTTRSGGTGLGLPTAKRIVEAHAGRLEMHTELGTGTEFTIVLPAAAPV